jgi:hypothetical protein
MLTFEANEDSTLVEILDEKLGWNPVRHFS